MILRTLLAGIVLVFAVLGQTCAVKDIGTGETVTAAFASGDCRLRNLLPGNRQDNAAHPYRVTLAADGILTVNLRSTAVDTYLHVYSLTLVRIATNDNAASGTTDSRVVIALRKGTYFLIASTRDVAYGAYTIQTSFGGVNACAEKELNLDAPAEDALASPGCRMMDLMAPSRDVSWTVPYRFVLTSRAVLTAAMTGTGFSPYLQLVNSDYDHVAYADADGDPEVELVASLMPGTYVLLASSSIAGDTGSFKLSAALSDPRSCPGKEIGLAEEATGELSYDADCRYLDLAAPSSDITPVNVYGLKIEKRSVSTLHVSSTDFTPYISIMDSKGVELNNTAGVEDPGPDAEIVTSLDTGVYFVVVNTYDDEGAYKLTSLVTEPRACQVTDVQPGQEAQGSLAEDGCRVLDLVPFSADPGYAAGHRLTITEPKMLTADQTAAQMDSALMLFGASSRLLAANDNNGSSKDSRIVTLLIPGEYLLAASAMNFGTGPYSLAAKLADAPRCEANLLYPPATLSSQLAPSDCRTREVVAGSTGGSFVKSYRMTFLEAGKVKIEASSSSIPVALVLTDLEGRSIAAGPTLINGSARLTGRVNPSTYMVHVAAMSAGLTGPFKLQVTFESEK